MNIYVLSVSLKIILVVPKLVESYWSYWFVVPLRGEEEAFITEFYFSELEENLSFVVINSLKRLKKCWWITLCYL